MPPVAAPQSRQKRSERFLGSVLWSWFGVAVSIFSGLLLSPYTIHKLGPEGYGVWTVIFAFVDYLWLLDLGFRSATLKYTAHYLALGQTDKIIEVLNTGVLYATAISAVTIVATVFLAGYVSRFENISPPYQRPFTILLIVVGIGWASGAVFNLFSASLEGFQRFDLTSRIWITSIAVRSFGIAAVLAAGHRLLAMGAVVLLSLALTYSLSYFSLRRIFPQFQFSPRKASFAMFRQMLAYGIHTFLAFISQQLLNQSPPILIAHFLPTAYAGYYGMAMRVPNYSVDLVNRVGLISGSHAAELAARNDLSAIARMGICTNRYCLTMFAPMAIAMVVYGRELFRVWISPEFAAISAPLLPVLAIGITLGVAAQFNSSSILYGLGKHPGYAKSLMVEAILCVAGVYLVLPRYQILGAAYITAILMVINRGLFTAWLLSRAVKYSFPAYLWGIYGMPTLVAIPVLLGAQWMKLHWLQGNNWRQIIAGGTALTIAYYAAAYFLCLEKQHRHLPVRWIRTRLGIAAA